MNSSMERTDTIRKGTGFFMPLTFRTVVGPQQAPAVAGQGKRRKRKTQKRHRPDSSALSSQVSQNEGEVPRKVSEEEVSAFACADRGSCESASLSSQDSSSLAGSPQTAAAAAHSVSNGLMHAWQAPPAFDNAYGYIWVPATGPASSPADPLYYIIVPMPMPLWSHQGPHEQDRSNVDQAAIIGCHSPQPPPPATASGAVAAASEPAAAASAKLPLARTLH
jgi:hypothetical protein